MGALVDIEHLAAVFGLADVEHLAAADGPAAVEVIFVTDLPHLKHVFAGDGFVAAFVEDD